MYTLVMIAADLVAITILALGIYYLRHRRRDLVVAFVGVNVGVLAVAVVLALRTVARNAHIEQVPLTRADHGDEERHLLDEHIVVYRIDGPLFFGAAHRLLLELPDVVDVEAVVLRMSRVTTIDATGARVLADAIQRLERRGIVVLLSGIAPGHEDVLRLLAGSDALRASGRILPDTPTAIARARSLLSSSSPTPPAAVAC